MNRLAIIFLFVCASLFAFDVESDIVARSQTYIGCAYRTGGTKPPEFDCSGFVGFIVRPYVPRLVQQKRWRRQRRRHWNAHDPLAASETPRNLTPPRLPRGSSRRS